MNTEYDSTSLGQISINNEVIKNIALKAALEVDGIERIEKCRLGKIWNVLSRKGSAYGVKLEFINQSEIKVTLKLMIDYNVNIPDVASAVQENVKKAVEHMTGLTASEVSVKIIGMQAQKNIAIKEGGDQESSEESISVKDEII